MKMSRIAVLALFVLIAAAVAALGQEAAHVPPLAPANPVGVELVRDAREFFVAGKHAANVAVDAAYAVRSGVYWYGFEHGALAAAALAAMIYFVALRPPRSP